MSIEHDYDEFLYHQHHAFSSTQARQILESPARYLWQKSQPARTSDAFDVGHAVHAKVLGVGAQVQVLDFPNFLTKAAKEARDDARAQGMTPLLAKDARQVDAMAEAVLAHDIARQLFEQPGHPEASVFATCTETAIEMRARFDYLPELTNDQPVAVDLKTTGTRATAREFGKSISTYGYHVQQGHYLDALELETGRDDIGFNYVVVEKSAPHFVAVHQIDDLYAAIGHDDALYARRTLRECTDTDTWPTGLEDIQIIGTPYWLADDVEVSV